MPVMNGYIATNNIRLLPDKKKASIPIIAMTANAFEDDRKRALNEGMKKFKGNMLFTSHDHQLVQTVADRIIDIRKDKVIDRQCTYNEYLNME